MKRLLTNAIKDTVSVLYWYEKLSRNGKFFEKIFESFFFVLFFTCPTGADKVFFGTVVGRWVRLWPEGPVGAAAGDLERFSSQPRCRRGVLANASKKKQALGDNCRLVLSRARESRLFFRLIDVFHLDGVSSSWRAFIPSTVAHLPPKDF